MSDATEILKRLDPARIITEWPAAPQADYVAAPDGLPPERGQPWQRRRVIIGSVLTSLGAAAVGVVVVLTSGPSAPVYAATPVPLRLEYGTDAPSARDALLRLAAVVEAGPASEEQVGRPSFARVGQWSLDLSSGRGITDLAVVPQVITTWTAPDGSGKIETVTLDQSEVGQRPNVSAVLEAARSGQAKIDRYSARDLKPIVIDPAFVDEDALETAIYAHQPRINGPQSAIRGVADLYRSTAASRDVRVAALRLLARNEGLLLRGAVTDRLGRRGLGVSVDSSEHGSRDLIVFDQKTGWLLAYESMLLRRPEKVPVRVPAVFSYVLYLDYGWRSDMP